MSPLHHIGEFLRNLLLHIPLGVVRAMFLLLLAALLTWVLFLPREQVTSSDASLPKATNLKIWAAAALIIQLLIYTFL